jgi:hypothetical protein
MAKTSTSFKKGTSGNPKGRPPKSRALTEALSVRGERAVAGKPAREVLADVLWKLALEGKAALPNGVCIEANAKEWFEAVKWIYAQIDGAPPKAKGDDDGEPQAVKVVVVTEDPKVKTDD